MSDLRSIVDRELERVELRLFTLETFHRRRARKRRNERITAGIVGIVIALIAVLIGTSIIRSSPQPATPAPIRTVQLTYLTDQGLVGEDMVSGRTTMLVRGADIGAYAWSPDGTRVAYTVVSSRHCGLWLREIAAGGARRLTSCDTLSTREDWGSVGWSGDGQWIVFTAGVDDFVHIVHPDGTQDHPLTYVDGTLISANRGISFSPDGARIAFGDDAGIFTIGLDGTSDPVFLAAGWFPSWSPDGGTIAFIRDPVAQPHIQGDPFVAQLWVMHADGSRRSKLFAWSHCCLGAVLTGPAWSPDGAQIALYVLSRLRVVHADGSNRRALPVKSGRSAPPAWRPVS